MTDTELRPNLSVTCRVLETQVKSVVAHGRSRCITLVRDLDIKMGLIAASATLSSQYCGLYVSGKTYRNYYQLLIRCIVVIIVVIVTVIVTATMTRTR